MRCMAANLNELPNPHRERRLELQVSGYNAAVDQYLAKYPIGFDSPIEEAQHLLDILAGVHGDKDAADAFELLRQAAEEINGTHHGYACTKVRRQVLGYVAERHAHFIRDEGRSPSEKADIERLGALAGGGW